MDYCQSDAVFNDIKETIKSNEPLFFGQDFGFEAPKFEDFYGFLTTTSQFGFKLVRSPGKGILYGVCHVKARRLFNGLPLKLKIKIIKQKFDVLGLWDPIANYLGEENPSTYVADIIDIGMGDSIYLLAFTLSEGHVKRIVIKPNGSPLQSLYGRFLASIGVPFVNNTYFKNQAGQWEIADYTGDKNLSDTISSKNLNKFAKDLGLHAAIGDILGRGDRHLENYGIKDGRVVPFDVSFLFCKDNHIWTKKYVESGMYEYSTIMLAKSSDDENNFKELFRDGFLLGKQLLQTHEQLLKKFIWDVYSLDQQKVNPESEEISRISSRILSRLSDSTYLSKQLAFYDGCVEELRYRQSNKLKLKDLVSSGQVQKSTHPWLYMYYLADKDRLSSFYLIEDNKSAQDELKKFQIKAS